ncbi:MAG: hypothetical protein ACFE9C_06590 [Candidatus Hodarchaeota archaeon]
MENAKNASRIILYIACSITLLLLINTYFILIHFLLVYFLVFIISIINSIFTRDMRDGILVGFYGSSLALILWLFIPFILSYLLNFFVALFMLSDFLLNLLMIILHYSLEILMILLLYKQKMRLLLYILIILFLVGYVFPLTMNILVEFGYMVDLPRLIQIILDFLLDVVGVISISTIGGLIGGWVGMRLLTKEQDKNLDNQQKL